MKKAAELGFLGVIFPEELGGAGLGYVEYVLVVTELSKVDPSVGISVAAHNSLCTNHIYKFGNDEQRRRWLPPLAAGEKIGAWALTEPGRLRRRRHAHARRARSTAAGCSTAPRPSAPTARWATSAWCLAVTEPEGRKGHNISAFVVERGTPGFRAGKKENKLGIRASDTAEVVLEDCFVPDDNLLGAPGEGFKQAMEVLDGGRISIAALGLGTAIGAYETRARLRQGARAVRQADRRVPGHPVRARRDGDADRRRRGPHLRRRRGDGPRPAR